MVFLLTQMGLSVIRFEIVGFGIDHKNHCL